MLSNIITLTYLLRMSQFCYVFQMHNFQKIIALPVGPFSNCTNLNTVYINCWCLIQAHHALSNMALSTSLFLVINKCNIRRCKWPAPKTVNSQGVSEMKSRPVYFISDWAHEKEEKGGDREWERLGSGVFSPNELTEATSISSNVMLKWKLIVQYAATASGHASSISISGGVTKWVCSLGPTPRKADTSTNQPDFSIWHRCAAGIQYVLYVCMSVCVCRIKRWGPITQGDEMERQLCWWRDERWIKTDGWKYGWMKSGLVTHLPSSVFISYFNVQLCHKPWK